MAMNSRDYYTILGVELNASQEELKDMYRKLAKKYHMDANSADLQLRKWSHEMMLELNDAYSVLKDPNKRKEYDQQRSSTYSDNPDSQHASETVYIQSLEHGKEILYDELDNFPFSGLAPELEESCRIKLEKLINKKPLNYLKLGIPNEYPRLYLASEIKNAVTKTMVRIQEENIRAKVFKWYFAIIFWIAVLFIYPLSDSFVSGARMVFAFIFVNTLYYFTLTWIARFIARGFMSNLIGKRGLIANGLVAIVIILVLPNLVSYFKEDSDTWQSYTAKDDKLAVLMPSAPIEREAETFKHSNGDPTTVEAWERYTSKDNKFSVLMPSAPIEEDPEIYELFNGEVTTGKEVTLNIAKMDSNTKFSISWVTHPELPNEYKSRLDAYEWSLTEEAGATMVLKEKIRNNSYFSIYDFPSDYSLAVLMLINNETLYFLTVITEDKNIKDPSIKKFFDSFEAK